MVVYIASDYPLPTSAWDGDRPGFHVVELSDRDNPVRRQFSKPCVYYVGSHEGCGCGFQYGQIEGIEEGPEQLIPARDSRRRLSKFLADALQHQPSLELFACWDGDQATDPEYRSRTRPSDLLRDRTYFREKELLAVSNEIA